MDMLCHKASVKIKYFNVMAQSINLPPLQWLKKVPPKVISAIDFNSAISLGVNFL